MHDAVASPESTPTRGAAARGTWLVVGLIVIGACLAVFAAWFQWRQTRRCLEWYGPETARRILEAPRVELWALDPADAAAAPRERLDVSKAAGLVHLRRGLVEDANFDWSSRPSGPWSDALAFFDAADATTPAAILLLDTTAPGGIATTTSAGIGLGRMRPGLAKWLVATRQDR